MTERAVVIDISSHRQKPDFDLVAQQDLDAIISRATLGVTYLDGEFERNALETRRIKKVRGAYMVPLMQLSLEIQVDFYLNTTEMFDEYDLPDAVDVERNDWGLSPAQMRDGLKENLELLEDARNRKPDIYTGEWFWARHVVRDGVYPDWLDKYNLWHAQYPDTSNYDINLFRNFDWQPDQRYIPKPWRPKSGLWQCSAYARCAGIVGNTDVSLYPGTLAEMLAASGTKPLEDDGDDDNGGGEETLEQKVAKIQEDVTTLKADVDDLEDFIHVG